MNIPKKTKIGAYWFKTKLVNLVDGGENVGSISFTRSVIQLARYGVFIVCGKKKKKEICRAHREESYCHETIHGWDAVYNGSTLTEKQVDNLGRALHQFIEDNCSAFK